MTGALFVARFTRNGAATHSAHRTEGDSELLCLLLSPDDASDAVIGPDGVHGLHGGNGPGMRGEKPGRLRRAPGSLSSWVWKAGEGERRRLALLLQGPGRLPESKSLDNLAAVLATFCTLPHLGDD